MSAPEKVPGDGVLERAAEDVVDDHRCCYSVWERYCCGKEKVVVKLDYTVEKRRYKREKKVAVERVGGGNTSRGTSGFEHSRC